MKKSEEKQHSPWIIVQGMPFEKSQLKSRSWLFKRRRALLLF
ncbi:MAG: hypothetical protein WBK43_13205 [Prolixibacteraceae bacterium]|jgi:hypothetical protein|nr:hypothetical protein [Bacteroidota bacterium]HNZ68272.1 hypothetical protein [Prolixibacteraceae bacterium]HOC85673.1 hypothetical protein [Prolixibacteraceae bacterium]HOG95344.1 hypothetical protein [Prolixibacteraceae bacterium]HOY92347.1 hypothetical protein [Prolixibacteraceae bacterium]